jgi:hypothetical protein
MTRLDVFAALSNERDRQEQLKAAGRFAHTMADPEMGNLERLACLGEEFGEACGAVVQSSGLSTDRTAANLRTELIHVGAVVIAWLEGL